MNRAKQAKEDTIIAGEKEQIAMAWNALILDKLTGNLEEDINEDDFETELKNSGNNTQVDNYVVNNENRGFSVTFIDTTHEYIVDKNGNITLKGTKTIDNVEVIEEEYIIENSELNSEYNIDGWGNDTSDGKPRKDSQWLGVDCYRTYAAWGGGKAGMYFEPKLDFGNITKIEADIILGSNLNGLTNTTTLGIELDEITKDDKFDVSETVVDKTSTGTEYHVIVDTSNISGDGYIKLYSTHGPESSAYTVATGVKNLKIYTKSDKPIFDVKYEQTAETSYKVTISNIKYIENISNWKVKFKKFNEENWQTSNNLSFTLNEFGTYQIKILSGNIESKVKIVSVGINMDFKNAQAYNTTSFTNNSTSSSGNYSIGFGGGYEKLNIPINNCVVDKLYILKFSMQVSNAQFYNSYSYSYNISDKIDIQNSNTIYSESLNRNSELNEYSIMFKATNSTMYLNLSIPDIKDGTYNFRINPY